ncbi:hypothetical protein L9G16_22510, partial [Shewanella sp. A25]|nr:hypothetical protein [Shewanella shenzhenensis]
GLVFPVWWKTSLGFVITSEPVNPGFYQDKAELGVLVFPVPFQMLPNSHSLLNQKIQIFW